MREPFEAAPSFHFQITELAFEGTHRAWRISIEIGDWHLAKELSVSCSDATHGKHQVQDFLRGLIRALDCVLQDIDHHLKDEKALRERIDFVMAEQKRLLAQLSWGKAP